MLAQQRLEANCVGNAECRIPWAPDLGDEAAAERGDSEVEAVDMEATEVFNQGLHLLRNNYPGKALVHLRRAVELDKNNPLYLSYLGVALARAGKNWILAEKLHSEAAQAKRTQSEFDLAEKLCSQA